MAGRVEWHGDALLAEVRRKVVRKLEAACLVVERKAKELVGVPGTETTVQRAARMFRRRKAAGARRQAAGFARMEAGRRRAAHKARTAASAARRKAATAEKAGRTRAKRAGLARVGKLRAKAAKAHAAKQKAKSVARTKRWEARIRAARKRGWKG